MVVIAIIGIMSAITIPNFISWLPDYRMRSAARSVVSCLQKTKMAAVKNNSNTVVVFTANGCSAFVDDGAGGGTADNDIQDGSEADITNIAVSAGISLSDININGPDPFKMGFNSRGLQSIDPTSNPDTDPDISTLKIENNKSNSITISQNKAGSIKLD